MTDTKTDTKTDIPKLIAEANALRTDSPVGDLVSYVRELADELGTAVAYGSESERLRLALVLWALNVEAERDAAQTKLASIAEWLEMATGPDRIIRPKEFTSRVERLLAESPTAALATVKADTLREYAAKLGENQMIREGDVKEHLLAEAARIEKEAGL